MNSETSLRIIAGLTITTLAFMTLFFGPFNLQYAFISLLFVAGLIEIKKAMDPDESTTSFSNIIFIFFSLSLFYLSVYSQEIQIGSAMTAFFLYYFCGLCVSLKKKKEAPKHSKYLMKESWAELNEKCFCSIYVFLLFAPLVLILKKENGKEVFLLLLFTVYLGDVFAYFLGRKFGKRKLLPLLSPGKSVEGALGNILGSITGFLIGSFITRHFFKIDLSFNASLHLGAFIVLVSILSQLGDLLESLFKRANNVKDSGSLIPGHGGILDRTDSLFFVSILFLEFFH